MVWNRRMAQGSHRAAQNVNRARRDRAATNMYMLGMPARRKSREGLGLAGGLPLAVAVRRTSAGGYDVAAFGADLFAGTVVGIVALPLSMALAIAVGVPPQHGLYAVGSGWAARVGREGGSRAPGPRGGARRGEPAGPGAGGGRGAGLRGAGGAEWTAGTLTGGWRGGVRSGLALRQRGPGRRPSE